MAENYPYRSDVLWVTVPNHADWLYKTGEQAAKVDGKSYEHHIKVGFSPEKLLPYTTLPTYFQTFWENAKAEQAKFPLNVANHPALSDMAGYQAGRAGGYPHLYRNSVDMDTPEKTKTLAL